MADLLAPDPAPTPAEAREQVRSRRVVGTLCGLLAVGPLFFFGIPLAAGAVLGLLGGLLGRRFIPLLRYPAKPFGVWLLEATACFLFAFGVYGWGKALTGLATSPDNVRWAWMYCLLFPTVLYFLRKL